MKTSGALIALAGWLMLIFSSGVFNAGVPIGFLILMIGISMAVNE